MNDNSTIGRRGVVLGALGAGSLTALGLATAPQASAVTTARLDSVVGAYLRSRGGTVGVSLWDNRTGRQYTYNSFQNETLSTIKVLILCTVLRVSREQNRPLTANQRYLIGRMMDFSDNAATDTLFAQVGLANVQRVARLFGLTYTVVRGGGAAGTANWWGYSTTIPWDWLKLATFLVNGHPAITSAERTYVRSWMSHVTASQVWGVVTPSFAPMVNAEVKNGWGPRTGGYRLNSIGHIKGYGRDYQAVMLSRSPNGFTYGRDTLNGLSSIIFRELATPLA